MPILSFSAGRERAAYLCKRIIWYGALIAACLLTHIPAAHAHDEDVPPSPEVTGLGVVARHAVRRERDGAELGVVGERGRRRLRPYSYLDHRHVPARSADGA